MMIIVITKETYKIYSVKTKRTNNLFKYPKIILWVEDNMPD